MNKGRERAYISAPVGPLQKYTRIKLPIPDLPEQRLGFVV